MYLPMRICSLLVALNRPPRARNTEDEINAVAQQTMQFRTALVAPRPDHAPKKRKIEVVKEKDGEVSEEILAQKPFHLLEPEHPPADSQQAC